MSKTCWETPYGTINKEIIVEGLWGIKPYDNSECQIQIKDSPDLLEKYNNSILVIGDNDSNLGRILDSCIISMHEFETAVFTCTSSEMFLSFTLTLEKLHFKGFIFDWTAAQKYSFAVHHKTKGIELFRQNKLKDAAYRFTKALKILSSIPIDVEDKPNKVDNIAVLDISSLKANLFNNLASCYLKNKNWLPVIDCCNKVLNFDSDNIKANYKAGVAFMEDKSYENAEKAFEKVLKLQPDNAVAKSHLKSVKIQLNEMNANINSIVKKMFSNVLH